MPEEPAPKKENKMHYAIMHCDNKVIAEAQTWKECQELADETKVWNILPGTHAPYCITTIAPTECSICGGSGKVPNVYEEYACTACEGTGYSIDFVGRKKTAPKNSMEGAGEQQTTAAVCKNCSLCGTCL